MDAELSEEQKAEAHLALFELSGGADEASRRLTLALFEKLYATTPKFVYNYHLSALRKQD